MEHIPFTVTVPWRSTRTREPLFQALRKWYAENLDKDVLSFDAPKIGTDEIRNTRFFNTAAARNRCVKESPTEIVVINDADTIPNKQAILQAVEYVYETGKTCLPYTRYNHVSYPATMRYLKGVRIKPQDCRIYRPAVGGIVVTTKTMWDRHNGQDERMFGWGYQDTAWSISYQTLFGDLHRIDADIYSLSHQLAERGENILNNKGHFQNYERARGDVEQMKLLIAGNRQAIE